MMNVTNDMLKAAIDKAIEAGLLPKYARKAESVAEREVIKLVVQAALDAQPLAPLCLNGKKKPADLAVAGESNSRRVGGDRKNNSAPQQILQLYSGDDTYS